MTKKRWKDLRVLKIDPHRLKSSVGSEVRLFPPRATSEGATRCGELPWTPTQGGGLSDLNRMTPTSGNGGEWPRAW